MIMVSVCLPSCNTYRLTWGFSYLGRGVSLHGCSSKAQPLLLTLDKGYLLTAAPPDLEGGIAPPAQPLLLEVGGVAPPCRRPLPQGGHSSSPLLLSQPGTLSHRP